MGSTGSRDRVGWGGARGSALPGGVRPGHDSRDRRLGGHPPHNRNTGDRSTLPSALSRREREGAPRSSARPTAGSRDARAGAIPTDLGRDTAGSRPAHPDPAGALPAARFQHEDAALRANLHRRWRRRRNLALPGRPHRGQAIRAPTKNRPPSGRRGSEPAGGVPQIKTAPHDGAPFLFEGRSLAALSGLRRPRGRLLRLAGRLRGPVLARLAATLLLRPLLARLRLPALVAVLLLALAHANVPPAE